MNELDDLAVAYLGQGVTSCAVAFWEAALAELPVSVREEALPELFDRLDRADQPGASACKVRDARVGELHIVPSSLEEPL